MNILKNKPERVFGLQVRCRELDSFKILGIFWDIFREFFLRNFLEEFDLFVKILVFFKILSFCLKAQGRKDKIFRSLEVREASSSHLK